MVDLYDAQLNEGSLWARAQEVVVGNAVAKDLNIKIGSTFFSSHGFNEGDLEHDDVEPFKVVGILKQSGTVTDKIIMLSLIHI